MTNEDEIVLIKERLDLVIQAINGLRELIELHGQRLTNIETKLFGLYPPKEH